LSVASGSTVTLDGTGSTDVGGSVASYAWTQTSGPAVTLSSATASQPTFTADTLVAGGAAVTRVFSLVVTDNLGLASTANTVTITVQPPANVAPTANAGPDQLSVASGSTVTLDGTGSTDVGGSVTRYAWTQTSGPTVTLSSVTAAQPTFTADTLLAGDAAVTRVFSLVVTDNLGLASVANTVTITVQSGPTVAITGLPTTYSGVVSFNATITFSKPVTGFVASDVTVSGGSVTSMTGSGATYTASITTSGSGDFAIRIAANVATDSVGNGNGASEASNIGNTIVAEVQTQTTQFMLKRATNILNTIPDLGGFLNGNFGGVASRNFNLNITNGSSLINFNGSLLTRASTKNYAGKIDVWAQIRYVGSDAGTASSRSLVGYLGAHRFASENMLYGVALQFDLSSENDSVASSSGSGTGFMIGPYVAGKIPNSALRYEAQASWGKSWNSISPIGTYTDKYNSERWFVRGKLQGSLQRGAWTIDPGISVAYFTDTQQQYVDSLTNTIPSQTITLGEVKVGPTFIRDFDIGFANLVNTKFGISAVSNFAIQNTAGSRAFPLGNGNVRTRLDIGLSTKTRKGIQLSASGFFDGIGVANFASYGATFKLDWKF